MFIQTFPSGPFSTNAYLVACEHTKQAAIIDPAPESAESLLNSIEQHQFKVDKIILTHSHWDHIADVQFLKEKLGSKVYIHSLDRPNLEQPGSDGLPCWICITGTTPDVLLQEPDQIQVGDLTFEVIHTPGHSPGSICLYERKESVLFSGDTLFKGTIGNLSFPTSQPDFMWNSLSKLSKLPKHTHVYPGHGPETSIGSESWLANAQQLFS